MPLRTVCAAALLLAVAPNLGAAIEQLVDISWKKLARSSIARVALWRRTILSDLTLLVTVTVIIIIIIVVIIVIVVVIVVIVIRVIVITNCCSSFSGIIAIVVVVVVISCRSTTLAC